MENHESTKVQKHEAEKWRPPFRAFGISCFRDFSSPARGNWPLLIRPEQQAERRELLELLGEHRAIVLCGHVHRYGFVVRTTDHGPFAQLAVSSILSSANQQPKQLLEGLDAYGPELTELEPSFQPETKEERRALFTAEKPFVEHYEYADAAGHAVLRIAGNHVTAYVCLGTAAEPWRQVDLTVHLESG